MLIVSGECKIPACLIESSYLDNKKKRNLIITDEYENKILMVLFKEFNPFLYSNKIRFK